MTTTMRDGFYDILEKLGVAIITGLYEAVNLKLRVRKDKGCHLPPQLTTIRSFPTES
jgi:hypothetical protein